ncbi:MAG TPA: ABC transporter permease [Acidimicrobiales bacterium]|nr:ABC transporter permease [Acidimicrobiales bacterium]
MKALYVVLLGAAVLVVRFTIRRRRRRRQAEHADADAMDDTRPTRPGRAPRARWDTVERSLGDVGLVAGREIRERVRGRIFRVGTVVILVVVAACIVIPALHKSSGPMLQRIGIVGGLSPAARHLVETAGKVNQDTVRFVPERSLMTAKVDLRSGRVDAVISASGEILLDQPVDSGKSSADPGLVEDVAEYLGVLEAYQRAALTPGQAMVISHAKPVAVRSLVRGPGGTTKITSVVGLVLLFFMLTQYCTWILIGVMQEKASRVVEVLLAMVRPLQLLGGKVVGIGLVALGQAALVVGFALAVGAAVGSDLLHGAAPVALLAELLWLVLGYAFYCWVYAAAGSTAERQDQVQTLALPLSLPILFAYVYSITVASTGSPNLFFEVLAYFPPTAPFCMSVLVGLGQVSWWQFVISVLIDIAATGAMALFAARIYRRAVLRTGSRVRLLELLGRPAR